MASQVLGFQHDELEFLGEGGPLFFRVVAAGVAFAEWGKKLERLLGERGAVVGERPQRGRSGRLVDRRAQALPLDGTLGDHARPVGHSRVHRRRDGHQSARVGQEVGEREAQDRLDRHLLPP